MKILTRLRGLSSEAPLCRTLLLLSALVLAGVAPTHADDYPYKPVRIVIPFAPGGINDVVGRLIATHLSERLGKKFIPENRTGAGGVVGSEVVAQAPHDGYTLLIVSIANATHPTLYKLSYDGNKAFAPIAFFASSPNVFAVNHNFPASSLKEFIALAKAKPGEIQYASGGVGGSLHLAMELFKDIAGVDLLHVPFRGAGPAAIDVIGGHTQALIATASTLVSHIQGGKLRGLAISGKQRNPGLPDVPTFAEAGLPAYEGGNWIGLSAPAGTPESIIATLNKEVAEIQKLPDVQKQLSARATATETMSPAEFGRFIDGETAKWGGIIKTRGIKPQ
jgi:tripartite-type tricarboxylate transporter receptor subunit TctC